MERELHLRPRADDGGVALSRDGGGGLDTDGGASVLAQRLDLSARLAYDGTDLMVAQA